MNDGISQKTRNDHQADRKDDPQQKKQKGAKVPTQENLDNLEATKKAEAHAEKNGGMRIWGNAEWFNGNQARNPSNLAYARSSESHAEKGNPHSLFISTRIALTSSKGDVSAVCFLILRPDPTKTRASLFTLETFA